MHVWCMDVSSPEFLSTEDSLSSTSGMEKEREPRKIVQKVTKRREKNKDAARKSRRKQTARADELHEELQDLERSNSAFQKEISDLKKELIFYQMTLKRHEPYCRLGATNPSSPSSCCSRSPNYHQASSSPPQASNCPSPAILATDLTVRTPSPSALSSTPTAAKMFQSSSSFSCPVNLSSSASVSARAASMSDFSKLPLTLLNLSNKPSVSPNPIPHTAAQSPQTSLSIKSFTDFVLAKLDASLAASPKMQVPIVHVEAKNTRAIKQEVSTSFLSSLSENPSSLSWPYGLAPTSHQVSSALTASGQTPLPHFAWKQNQQASFKPKYLHSLVTGPSPLNIYQANSCIPSLSFSQMQATVPDPSHDVSLSELLEFNDWILSGPANQ